MIWCDLDNTLIWTWEPVIGTPLLSAIFKMPIENKPPRGKGRRVPVQIEVPEFGYGYVCVRRSARRFLRALRQIGEVRMLTAAARSYAEVMNSTFGFGFTSSEIVTRENMGAGNIVGTDSNGILIDNEVQYAVEERHSASRRRKLRYLGISPARVVEVSYFDGSTDDPFEREWRQHVSTVRRLLQEG